MHEAGLRRYEYRAQTAIDEKHFEVCHDLSLFNEWRDHAKRQLIVELRAHIYGKRHPDKHVIRYPENWWEAVKERFAPAWFRDRYPVRFVTITATLEEVYPELSAVLPEKHPVMRFATASHIESPTW
jgi:hypothetical protein